MNPGRTEIMNRTHSQRRWVSSAAGLSVAATLLAACAAGGGGAQSVEGKPTLNAIFLPATWGQVVKDKLAPEYEKETGVHVEVQLIGRDAIHEQMATLFAGQDSSCEGDACSLRDPGNHPVGVASVDVVAGERSQDERSEE
jgi:ABC-type glycerol-3-phosphate transport system substrate-binding protein